jgi:2-hydroxychromene-2-carboxylate isomerase
MGDINKMKKISFKDLIYEKVLTSAGRRRLHPETFAVEYDGEEHFPLNDANHIRSAISYFHKCPKDKQEELAEKIFKKAKKYGIEIDEDAEVYKVYYGE